MKPYGKKYHKHNHPDNHPKKGYINWWEYEIDQVKSKKTERQRYKKEIKNGVEALVDEHVLCKHEVVDSSSIFSTKNILK